MRLSRLAALAACFTSAISANATHAAFVMTLSDGATNVVLSDDQNSGFTTDSGLLTTIGDGNISEAGLLTFNGAIGSFLVNVTTGVSDPLIGPGRIDLNSINVSGGSGTLTIRLTDTDFTGSAPSYNAEAGGTTDGSIDLDFFYGSTNQEFAGTLIDSFALVGDGFVGGSSTQSIGTPASPYSLTIVATISHDGAGQVTSFDAVLTPVPIPAAVWMFGTGLVGLAGVARRRS